MVLSAGFALRTAARQAIRRSNPEILGPFSLLRRCLSDYAAVVAGSGPAGLAVVGNLLQNKVEGKVLWVDPELAAGKLDKAWREVPSNTKVNLFLQYAKALEPFQHVIDKTPKPNAITVLEGLQQDKGCEISYAADMCLMLSKGLREMEEVDGQRGKVTGANWNSKSSRWTVEFSGTKPADANTVSASCLVLCTGATPKGVPLPVSGLKIERIDVDAALTPSVLTSTLPNDPKTTVAVVGASHSAILVLYNLFNLAQTSHPQLRVLWFTRSSLLYAEQKDGWILYDNTGLKGQAATFAKENLEDSKLPSSPVGKFVQKVDCTGGKEQEMYEKYLPKCTHIIQATGFATNPLPMLTSDGNPIGKVEYDPEGGGFVDSHGNQVPGLYGAGIAFPERVKDPAGNVERAVGLFKFQRYLKRVVSHWVGKSAQAA